MTELLRMNLLGGLSLAVGQEPMGRFVSSKAPALLSYLACTGQPHTRAALTGLLWGESPEAQAKASLRQVLTDLRRSFAPYLLIERDAVTFNQQAPHWLDVTEFAHHFQSVMTGRGQDKVILNDIQAAALQAAADLYRGDLLAGFYVPTAPAFEEWVTGEQEWLRQAALQTLHRLTLHYTAKGAYLQGINAASRLLSLEPWQEEAHRQLMLLLALNGQRSAAIAQFETCRRVLGKDLGVEPTPATLALFEQIRTGEVGPEQSEASPALSSSTPNNLPFQATSFIGRESELAQIVNLLQRGDCRVVTITGASGVGKTRLALAAASRILAGSPPSYPHGIWFVPLTGFFSAGEVDLGVEAQLLVDEVGEAMSLTFSCPSEPTHQLIDLLRGRKTLFILDDLKHVPPSALAFLHELLEGTEETKLVFTSQAPLGLPGEAVVTLEGLPLPLNPYGPCAGTCESVQLFVERADRAAGGFAPRAEDFPFIAEICRLMAGSPLGIELAASWAEHWEPTDILAALQKQLPERVMLGTAPDVDVTEGVVAAFDGCWDLLPPQERQCLANLVVFAGEFSEVAAEAIIGTQSETLEGLVQHTLLLSPAPERFILHRLIHQLARRKLDEEAQGTDLCELVRDRHSFYYLSFLSQREGALQKRQMPKVLAEIQKEWRNIRAAWRWAAEKGSLERLQRAVNALSRYLYLRGMCQVGERMFGEAAAMLAVQRQEMSAMPRPVEALIHHMVQGQLLAGQARFLNLQGDNERMDEIARSAEAQFADALSQAQALDIHALAIACLNQLGSVSVLQNDYTAARDYLVAALDLYEEMGDSLHVVNVLSDLGVVMMLHGDYAAAHEYLERCQRECRRSGNRAGEGLASYNLGRVSDAVGWYHEAGSSYEYALRISREIGDERLEVQTLASQALLLFHVGDHDAAWEVSHQAARLAQATGNRLSEAQAQTVSGHALLALGLPGEAATAYRQAVSIERELGQINLAIEPLAGQAEAALAVGRVGQATSYVEEILLHLAPDDGVDLLASSGLKGTSEPFRVWQACIRVLRTIRSSHAHTCLSCACTLLLQQADRISDAAMRRSYLDVLPHREIIQASEAAGFAPPGSAAGHLSP